MSIDNRHPGGLVARIEQDGRHLRIRPIRPDDQPALRETFKQLSPEDVRMRFLSPLRTLSHEMAARLAHIDYDREMALVLFEETPGGAQVPLGVVRLAADADLESAEFAVVVVSSQQGKGFGRLLMERIIAYARQRGIKELFGAVLAENMRMLGLAAALGFEVSHAANEPGVMRVAKRL